MIRVIDDRQHRRRQNARSENMHRIISYYLFAILLPGDHYSEERFNPE